MKEELGNLNEALGTQDAVKKDLDSQILQLEGDYTSYSSKLSMLEKHLDEVEQEQEDIKHDVSARKERLVEKENQMEALESDQDKDEDFSVNLEDTSKRLAEAITAAEGVLEDYKRKLRVLSSLVEKREEELEKNQERVSKTKEQLDTANVEISEMEQDEIKLSKDECALRDELKGINAEFLEVDTQFENLVRQRSSLEHIISEKNKKLEQLHSECDEQEKIMEQFNTDFDEI